VTKPGRKTGGLGLFQCVSGPNFALGKWVKTR
jgi:hypothetical protein